MELAAAGEDMKELREIARMHLAKCKEGDLQAIKELADRLDGKPVQALEHSDTGEDQTRKVIVEYVHRHEPSEQTAPLEDVTNGGARAAH